jgi:hypothetical protein
MGLTGKHGPNLGMRQEQLERIVTDASWRQEAGRRGELRPVRQYVTLEDQGMSAEDARAQRRTRAHVGREALKERTLMDSARSVVADGDAEAFTGKSDAAGDAVVERSSYYAKPLRERRRIEHEARKAGLAATADAEVVDTDIVRHDWEDEDERENGAGVDDWLEELKANGELEDYGEADVAALEDANPMPWETWTNETEID